MEIKQVIQLLENEKEILKKDIEEKETRLKEIETTISIFKDVINNTSVICPECNGKGKKFHRSCAEDEGDFKICNRCKGDGKIQVRERKW